MPDDKIKVVGTGPGGSSYLIPRARQAILECGVLVGGSRIIKEYSDTGKDCFILTGTLGGVLEFIKNNRHKGVAVLATGDPGMYGILTFLLKHFPREDLEVIPGISTVQAAFALLAIPWQDARVLSVHGREFTNIAETLIKCPKAAILTGPGATPVQMARMFTEAGMGQRRAYLCYDITLTGEQVVSGNLEELAQGSDPRHNCVMVIIDEQ